MENYCKRIHIEGLTMVDMASKQILPAVSEYTRSLCTTLISKRTISDEINASYETDMIAKISDLSAKAYVVTNALAQSLEQAHQTPDVTAQGMYYKEQVLPKMEELRVYVDELEQLVAEKCWPFPNYGDLMFGV
jgi:glutamine synthetase